MISSLMINPLPRSKIWRTFLMAISLSITSATSRYSHPDAPECAEAVRFELRAVAKALDPYGKHNQTKMLDAFSFGFFPLWQTARRAQSKTITKFDEKRGILLTEEQTKSLDRMCHRWKDTRFKKSIFQQVYWRLMQPKWAAKVIENNKEGLKDQIIFTKVEQYLITGTEEFEKASRTANYSKVRTLVINDVQGKHSGFWRPTDVNANDDGPAAVYRRQKAGVDRKRASRAKQNRNSPVQSHQQRSHRNNAEVRQQQKLRREKESLRKQQKGRSQKGFENPTRRSKRPSESGGANSRSGKPKTVPNVTHQEKPKLKDLYTVDNDLSDYLKRKRFEEIRSLKRSVDDLKLPKDDKSNATSDNDFFQDNSVWEAADKAYLEWAKNVQTKKGQGSE